VEGANRIDQAVKLGAYATLKKAYAMQPAAIVDEVKKSNLRGRGGAGFPTGMKWGFIPKDAKTTYLVINADESEPGTCKDRELLYWDPHTLIEGVLISSYALGCTHAYIYIRGEMIREYKVVQRAVDEAYARGTSGARPPRRRARHHRASRRRRICSEETRSSTRSASAAGRA
jgi:NADH-quinone oxidoreductase subunit F